MDSIVFASHNEHKLQEVSRVLNFLAIESLTEIGINEDIPETGLTIKDNAFEKANYVFSRTGKACFADDTGLEVPFLGNAPGIYTARYAFMPSDFEAGMRSNGGRATAMNCVKDGSPSFDQNMDRLLLAMSSAEGKDREASFLTMICYIDPSGEAHFFEGRVQGSILLERRGKEGFGYDPIFMPKGYDCSFAELSMEEKNRISHRGLAVAKFKDFLLK